MCSFTTSFTTRGRFVSEASHDHFEWGFDNPFRELCVPLLQVLLQRDESSQGHSGSRPGTPSVSCVFLYYTFYYNGTIGVQVKPRPLWKRSWDPLRELCFFTTSVTRTGRLASKSSQCVPPTQLNATNPSVVIRTHDNLILWRVGVYVCETFHATH